MTPSFIPRNQAILRDWLCRALLGATVVAGVLILFHPWPYRLVVGLDAGRRSSVALLSLLLIALCAGYPAAAIALVDQRIRRIGRANLLRPRTLQVDGVRQNDPLPSEARGMGVASECEHRHRAARCVLPRRSRPAGPVVVRDGLLHMPWFYVVAP